MGHLHIFHLQGSHLSERHQLKSKNLLPIPQFLLPWLQGGKENNWAGTWQLLHSTVSCPYKWEGNTHLLDRGDRVLAHFMQCWQQKASEGPKFLFRWAGMRSTRTGRKMQKAKAPYLSHRQDKIHGWVLWINSLQLHPHFKPIPVLGSYLVLETKIKIQCKKMADINWSRIIPRNNHQPMGAAGPRRLWATGYVFGQIVMHFPQKKTCSFTSL